MIGDIARHGDYFTHSQLHRFRELIRGAGSYRNLPTLFREAERNGSSDAASTTCHQSNHLAFSIRKSLAANERE